jgi:pSer/pThr/pTyr-binding forkhead associated (FHA) protein
MQPRVFERELESTQHSVWVGRAAEADIRLVHPTISQKQLTFFRKANGLWVRDEKSKNPTRLNERTLAPLQPQQVRPGDILTAGPFMIAILDPTAQVDSDAMDLGTQSMALELARQMLEANPEEHPFLSVGESGAQVIARLPLGEPFVMGRDPGCDLPVDDSDVSRHHCRVFCDLEGCWLSDLNSKNGTFVSQERLVGTWKLQSGQVFRIGNTRVAFTDPAELYLAALEGLAESAVGDGEGGLPILAKNIKEDGAAVGGANWDAPADPGSGRDGDHALETGPDSAGEVEPDSAGEVEPDSVGEVEPDSAGEVEPDSAGERKSHDGSKETDPVENSAQGEAHRVALQAKQAAGDLELDSPPIQGSVSVEPGEGSSSRKAAVWPLVLLGVLAAVAALCAMAAVFWLV